MHYHTAMRLTLLTILTFLSFISAHAQLRVVSPNGGETAMVGKSYTITWAGISAAEQVSIDYSTDAGQNWSTILNFASGLSYVWDKVPQPASNRCLIRIRVNSTSETDISDGQFVIGAPVVAASNIDLRSTPVGTPKDTLVVAYISNGGIYPFTVDSIKVSGTDAADFTRLDAATPFTLQPARGQDVTWRFSPTSPGQKTATVTIYTETEVLARTITATATGTTQGAQVTFGTFAELVTVCEDFTNGIITLNNAGDRSIVINDVRIAGLNVTDFSILSSPVGQTIAAGSAANIGIKYDKPTVGTSTATLEVLSTADNPLASTQIRGRHDSLGVDCFPKVVNLYNKPQGSTVDTVITVVNTGSFIQTITVNPIGAVTVSRSTFVLQPGQSDTIRVRLVVDTTKQVAGSVGFTVVRGTCGRSVSLDFLFRKLSGTPVVLAIGKIAGNVGDVVNIPLTISPALDLNALGIQTMTITLAVDASILIPAIKPLTSNITGSIRTVTLKVPLQPMTDSTIATIPFKIALGNDSISSVTLASPVSNIGVVVLTVLDGEVKVADLCYQGGVRLLSTDSKIDLQVAPALGNQLEARATLAERGRTTLSLYDHTGNLVSVLFNESTDVNSLVLPIPTSSVSSGPYFLQLITPTQVLVVPVMVP